MAVTFSPWSYAGSIGLGFRVGLNGNDCAYFTVTDAIAAAPTTGRNTIFIQHGSYGELLGQTDKNLTFVPALPGSQCTQQDMPISNGLVTISGEGGPQGGNGGLLEVFGGGRVTFRNMTLTQASATNGGIVAVTGGSTLVLDNVGVSGGTAIAAGGLIYSQGMGDDLGQVMLINGTRLVGGASNNGDGGAVALFNSRLVVQDSAIGGANVTDINTAGNNGGGVYASQSEVAISGSGSLIRGNQAGFGGGGLYLENSILSIADAQIENNTAQLRGGGGVHLSGGQMTATQTSFSENATQTTSIARGGGAVFADNASVTIDSSDFDNNTSTANGGAVYGSLTGELIIRNNSTFQQNTALGFGGAIAGFENLTLQDVIVSSNTAGDRGGGVVCQACISLSLVNVTVSNNIANDAGGLDMFTVRSTPALIEIEASSFNNNWATSGGLMEGLGGAIKADHADLRIVDTSFTNNLARVGGGALLLTTTWGGASLEVIDSVIDANGTSEDDINWGGGGIFADGVDTITITNTSISDNASDGSGGAFSLRNSSLAGLDLTLSNNTARSGGCIHTREGTLDIRRSVFDDCAATDSGGGIRATSSQIVLDGVTMRSGSASSGGGMYMIDGMTRIRNTGIDGNSATVNGGGVFLLGGDLDIASDFTRCNPADLAANRYCSEITNNLAGEFGGGIYALSAEDVSVDQVVSIGSTLLRGNEAGDGGAAVHLTGQFVIPQATLVNSLIEANGAAGQSSPAVLIRGDGGMAIESSTFVGNRGIPLLADDPDSPVALRNSVIYLNDEGPQVVFGIEFFRSCSNSQPSTPPSQLIANDSSNPAFDGGNPRGDYRLQPFSPGVDRCEVGPNRDLDGFFRPNDGGLHDQGAFELNGAVMLPDSMFMDGFE